MVGRAIWSNQDEARTVPIRAVWPRLTVVVDELVDGGTGAERELQVLAAVVELVASLPLASDWKPPRMPRLEGRGVAHDKDISARGERGDRAAIEVEVDPLGEAQLGQVEGQAVTDVLQFNEFEIAGRVSCRNLA